MARIGVVVATWEDSELTLGCVASLLKLAGIGEWFELAIVVCDDASAPAVFETLQRELVSLQGSVSLVQLPERSGYAACLNHGIAELRSFSPDYLWLLNNDTEVGEAALQHLLAAAHAEPDVQLWGSTVVSPTSGNEIECAGGCTYSPLTTRNTRLHAGQPLSKLAELPPQPMDYVFGAAMFLPASAVEAAGGFCEYYFLYFEEQDIARRLPQPTRLGWCRDSLVYHVGAASTGGGEPSRSRMQQYYENLSTLRFTRRYYPYLLPVVFASRLLLKPLLFAVRGEWQLYRPFALALLDFLRGRPARRYS